jgi:formamidopyrimidine-DNA glycosylase
MPELPEVETVRAHLEAVIVGRTIRSVRFSGLPLRAPIEPGTARRLAGRRFLAARRHGKYLLLDLDRGLTLVSHLGMSGRWLFHARPPRARPPHVHARVRFGDGGELWFEDPRRFGLLLLAASGRLGEVGGLAILGPDPIAEPPSGETLERIGRGSRVSAKQFLMDQRRVAGIGNIYASEILHRAGLDPRTPALAIARPGWDAIARETVAVLGEAIARSGTTFSMYRTLWNEPGAYGDQLRVYDRSGAPCRTCGTPIRRIVQGARSTFFCPRCQPPARVRRARAGRPSATGRRSGALPRPLRGLRGGRSGRASRGRGSV